MLSVLNKPIMHRVVMLNVIMLSVAAPFYPIDVESLHSELCSKFHKTCLEINARDMA
jgi:hypothetical protein